MRGDEEERKEDMEVRYMELHEGLPLFVGGCEISRLEDISRASGVSLN